MYFYYLPTAYLCYIIWIWYWLFSLFSFSKPGLEISQATTVQVFNKFWTLLVQILVLVQALWKKNVVKMSPNNQKKNYFSPTYSIHKTLQKTKQLICIVNKPSQCLMISNFYQTFVIIQKKYSKQLLKVRISYCCRISVCRWWQITF